MCTKSVYVSHAVRTSESLTGRAAVSGLGIGVGEVGVDNENSHGAGNGGICALIEMSWSMGVAEGRRLRVVACMWYAGRLKVVLWLMRFHIVQRRSRYIFHPEACRRPHKRPSPMLRNRQ
jgi:hypothetical protein